MRGRLSLVLLLLLMLLPRSMPFTVIVPNSNVPSTLIDSPETGFAMSHDRARTDHHEQEAVYEIMKATGNSWATSIPDVCRGRWHGIECLPDKEDVYHVVSLSFGALSDDTAFPTCDQTTSFISPSLTKLPHIKTLFFYQCFTNNPHPIPSFLAQLAPTLQSLVLRENGHVGPIPTQLGNLTMLRVLDLHSNNLTSEIPPSLAGLTRLRSLDLSSNRLTGRIPDLPTEALNVLDLSQNLLMGPIPPTLGACHSLIKMDLSRNYLSGSIPDAFQRLNKLMLLDLSYNRLSGPLPASVSSLTSLRALILKGNSMQSTAIPDDVFSPLKNLMILVLSDLGLNGPIPDSLAHLPALRVLHLDQNYLNGSIPQGFRHSGNLNELRVNDNRLVGPIPFNRDMVWRMGRKLRLSNNSALCYDGCSPSGRNQGVDESITLGIGCCGSKPGVMGATIQHLSSIGHQQAQPLVSGAWATTAPTALLSKLIFPLMPMLMLMLMLM